jgi:capsular exopolysaccharide synthesis family protein
MAQENQEIDIRAWVLRILKNWYWFVLSCLLMSGLGVLYYYSTTFKFRVDASIKIRTQEEKSFLQREMMDMVGMGSGKNVEDEIEMLTSRDILFQVINDLDLQTEYRKKKDLRWVGQYPSRDFTVVYPPTYLDTLSKSVRIQLKVRENDYLVKVKYGRWDRSRHKVTDLTQPIHTCAGTISFEQNPKALIENGNKYKMLTLPRLPLTSIYKNTIEAQTVEKESNIISISMTTDIPARALAVITRDIELYNMDAVVDKNIMASNTAHFIEERLRLIEQELITAEKGVTQYKEKHDIVMFSEDAEIVMQENLEYRKRIAEIETQLSLVQFVSDFVADDTQKNSLIPSNLGISNESLVGLITQYNALLFKKMRIQRTAAAENPIVAQLDMQLGLVRDNIKVSVDNLRKTLLVKKNSLNDRYSITDSQRSSIPAQEREIRELVRNKNLKEQLYLHLYKQREDNALTLASTVIPAKMIATPQVYPDPVKPRMKLILLVCLFFGVCIPFGIMVIYDIMNNRISDDHKELEKKLKIPFAGMLVRNHRGEHVAVREGENSVSAELFRSLRTNIRFMQPVTEKCPVMLVTSSVNGEGKSYVATNLAISLALLGKKVALVGLDIRKPMLATYLNLPSQGCLTSYLSDDAYSLEDTIVPSNITNLDILPAGIIPPNPSELLQSERLDMLFAELRKQYDYVLIDSAPVALVSDTFLLNRVADMTVYVTRANYTTYELIDFLNQTHEQQRLSKMVAVLNGVDAKEVGYGYGYGYGQQTQPKKWWQLKQA